MDYVLQLELRIPVSDRAFKPSSFVSELWRHLPPPLKCKFTDQGTVGGGEIQLKSNGLLTVWMWHSDFSAVVSELLTLHEVLIPSSCKLFLNAASTVIETNVLTTRPSTQETCVFNCRWHFELLKLDSYKSNYTNILYVSCKDLSDILITVIICCDGVRNEKHFVPYLELFFVSKIFWLSVLIFECIHRSKVI